MGSKYPKSLFLIGWGLFGLSQIGDSQPAYLFPSTSGLGTSISNPYEGPAFLSSSPSNYHHGEPFSHTTAENGANGNKDNSKQGSSGDSSAAVNEHRGGKETVAVAAAESQFKILRDARVIIPVGIAPADDFVFKPPSYGVMPAHAASPRGWDKWGWASGPPGPHSPPSGWARMPSRGMVLSQEEMLDQLLHEQRYDRRERPLTLSRVTSSGSRLAMPVPVNITLTLTSMQLSYQQPKGFAVTSFDLDLEIRQSWFDSRLTFRPPTPSFPTTGSINSAFRLNAIHHYSDLWQPDVCAVDQLGRFMKPKLQVQQGLHISSNGTVSYIQRRSYLLECTGPGEMYPFDRRFCDISLVPVESGPEELGLDLKFVNQIEAMSDSLKLNQLTMTDIWTSECSNSQKVERGCLRLRVELNRRDLSHQWLTLFAPDILLVSMCSLTFWMQDSGSSSSSKTIGLARMILAVGSFLAHYGEDRPASYALNLWSLATLAFLFIAALECVFLQKLNDVRSAKFARQNGGANSRSARGNRNFAGVRHVPPRKSYYHNNRLVTHCVMTEDDHCRGGQPPGVSSHHLTNQNGGGGGLASGLPGGSDGCNRQQTVSTSTSINVVNSIVDERHQQSAAQQCGTINGPVGGCGVGSSNRIYRDLETGFSTSGSSRAGSTGSTGVSGTVVRPATLDFTDIGEEATAYSDDNLCEDQTMENLAVTPSNEYFHLNGSRLAIKSNKRSGSAQSASDSLGAPIDNLFKVMFPACYLLFLITYFTHYMNN